MRKYKVTHLPKGSKGSMDEIVNADRVEVVGNSVMFIESSLVIAIYPSRLIIVRLIK